MPDPLEELLRAVAADVDPSPPGALEAVRSARTRRHRRVGGTGLLAVVVALGVAVLVPLTGNGHTGPADDAASATPGPPGSTVTTPVDPGSTGLPPLRVDQGPLSLALLQVLPDDRTLAVAEGSGCFASQKATWQLSESADRVAVRLVRQVRQPAPGEGCSLGNVVSVERLLLDRPLGRRTLVVDDLEGARTLAPRWRGRLVGTSPDDRLRMLDAVSGEPGSEASRGDGLLVRAYELPEAGSGQCRSYSVGQRAPGVPGSDGGEVVGHEDVNGEVATLQRFSNGVLSLTWTASVGPVEVTLDCPDDQQTAAQLLEVARSLIPPG